MRDEDYLFVNFEDYIEFKNPYDFLIAHEEIYGKEPRYIFLDEIQSLKIGRNLFTLFMKRKGIIFL